MNKKKNLVMGIFLLAGVSFLFSSWIQQETAKELFERALYFEDTKGDLEKAIEVYKRVVREFPDERATAAQAQLHIGLCYEKSGLQEAQKAFQKVIDNYPEQTEIVKKARKKLAILLSAQSILGKQKREFTIRKVWSDRFTDTMGEVSPDGRYLSFVDWDTGDIALRNIVTGKNERLSNKGSWFENSDFALFSIWSPDGKIIAYNWFNEKDILYITDLRIYSLEEATHQILYDKSEYAQPLDWSPDGKYILTYFTGSDKRSYLGLLSVQNGSMQTLKLLGKVYPYKASFSPDGRYCAYDLPFEKDSYNRDIFILSTDGKHETTLVEHPADDALIGWTPDGKSILFVSNRTGTFDLWAIRVSHGKPQGKLKLIRKDMGHITPMGFTRNGSLYYGLSTAMQDIYIATLNIAKGKLLSPPIKASEHFIGSNISPDWSPDGKYLAYVSMRLKGPERPGSRILCIKNLESGKEKEFTPELKSFGRFLYWAPDGNSIYVTGIDMDYNKGLYKLDTQTGMTLLFYKKTDIIDFIPSPEGKLIYYRGWNDTKNMSYICQYNLLTKQEKELYRAPSIINLAISPDGKLLAFCYADEETPWTTLKIIPVKGGEPRDLVRVKQPEGISFQSCTWTPDGRYILYGTGTSTMENPKVAMWGVSVDGGEPQKLGLSMDWLRHIRVHPDGKRVTFFAGQSTAEIWVMENFLPEVEIEK